MLIELIATLVFSLFLFYIVFTFPLYETLVFSISVTLIACFLKLLLEGIISQLGFRKKKSVPFSRRVRSMSSRFCLGLLVLVCLKSIWFYLMFPPPLDYSVQATKVDILERRAYLIERLEPQTFNASLMPAILPAAFKKEWAIGTLSMTTAALTNISFIYPETREDSLRVIHSLIDRFLEQDMRDYEVHYWGIDALKALDTEYGQVGYLGHLNFMLGAYRLLGGENAWGSLHEDVSRTLARRLRNRDYAYLETFPGQIYVPDNMVVLASLAIADKTLGIDFKTDISNWLERSTSQYRDSETGLLVNWVGLDKQAMSGVRGSYSSWNSFYLPFVDETFAAEQFELVKKHFVVSLPFGFSGIREFPHGVRGRGDIDSGPVIFGLSTSGCAFAMAGASRFGDKDLLEGLLLTAELVGGTVHYEGKRWYSIAPLIGEAIVLAMRTATRWDLRYFDSEGAVLLE